MKKTVVLFSLLLAAALSVPAADMVWTGAGENANWGNPDNWETAVPGAGDRAHFTSAAPGATTVTLETDHTLGQDVSNVSHLLFFNSAHDYTINGPGTLTFSTADTTSRDMIRIGANAEDTTQTFNADLVFATQAGGGIQRIATDTDAHYVFNGSLTYKQPGRIRLDDLNSTATFNGNVLLENNSALQLYGGTLRFNDAVLGDEDGGVVLIQGQGRPSMVYLGNTDGPAFDSSLTRVGFGVSEPGANTATIRMEAEDQVACNVWLRVALWDLNGFDNRNTGALRLPSANEEGEIRFGNGEALWFADSSDMDWGDGATVNLIDFEFDRDEIRFGTDADGLTQSQLGKIRVDGQVVEGLALNGGGYLIPEPATMGMLGIGVLIVVTVRRRFMRR